APSMYTGEDLGAGYPSAGGVLAGWQASPAHNAVLLNPNYNAVGIGLVYNASSTYKWYWAAYFGGPGGTVKIAIPPPAPAAQAARSSAAEPINTETADEASDPAAEAETARVAFIEALRERRIVHLIAVLLRMGVI